MTYTFPVIDGRITSGFGHRSSPGGIGSTNHKGIDIGGARGSPILSTVGGEVIFAGRAGGYGNQVQVLGSDGLVHSFSHLDSISVAKGSNIGGGTILGALGMTGNTTGPHLHYGVSKDGKFLNPSGIINSAKKIGKDQIDKAKGLVGNALNAALMSNPATAPFALGANIAGLNPFGGDDCGIICQIKKWIMESGFIQRAALAVFAFILLVSAFYLMKGNPVTNIMSSAKRLAQN